MDHCGSEGIRTAKPSDAPDYLLLAAVDLASEVLGSPKKAFLKLSSGDVCQFQLGDR
jgi:hypothetical protein